LYNFYRVVQQHAEGVEGNIIVLYDNAVLTAQRHDETASLLQSKLKW